DVGVAEDAVAQHRQAAPRPAEHTGLRVAEIGAEPARLPRAGDDGPGLAAVVGGEDAAAVAVVGIAGDEAVLVVEELDRVQAGQLIDGDGRPLQPTVACRQPDGATAAAGQLLATDGPAGEWIEEAQAAQRAAHAGVLPLPGLAAVDRVPDHAFVAGGPAF